MRNVTLGLILCACAAILWAQAKTVAASSAAIPTIRFTFDFPQSSPEHYSLVVDSAGHATYVSGAKKGSAATDADSGSTSTSSATSDELFQYDFQVSEATRARIFDLAARARYFEGDLNYTKHAIASTGNKTLAYKDGQRSTSASYNYTSNQPVQQLTALFQNISATLEFGHRLEYLHHYQKLALEEEMKRMEDMARENSLAEIQAVAPILKQIVADQSVINVARARAERLLAQAGTAR
jgi:hypothetical protein